MRFVKKPIEIEAWRWDGSMDAASRIVEMADKHKVIMSADHKYLVIETLEGAMRADMGDWVIKGVKGEIYPCKPDIFEATYEPV